MANINEVAKSTVLLDGNQAEQELKILANRADKLNKELDQLRRANDKAGFDKKRKELQQVKKEMRALENQTKDVTQVLKKLNGASLDELYRAKRKLRAEMKGLRRDTKEYVEKSKQYKLVTREIAKATGAVRSHGTMWNRALGTFNKYLAIVTVGIATITGMIFSIKEWIRGNVGLSDSLADVMKTTNLTRKQVRELYTEFKYFNTRTPRKELLALAEEAGRLGIKSKKEVLDFVEVANQIKVALGDDLGGNAEVAIREVGKLTKIFQVGKKHNTDFRKSMLMVGSAINEVSANSAAQAAYLIDWTKRTSGLAKQTSLNIDQIIGYATALDEEGQTLEMSATAVNKAVVNMFKDTEMYAGIAGMGVSEFTELLKTDTNEAFLKFLEGLNGNNEGLSVMATKLDELELDGSRAIQVLATLAATTDKVRDRQGLANRSLIEATSLTTEYNVKNENLAGNVDRIGRAIRSWFINSKLVGWLESVTGWMAELVKVPVSEKLEKERRQVNMLVIEMTDLNTEAERKKEIYDELQKIAPDVVEDIKLEALNTEELRKKLRAYNEEMVKKIAIQESEDELEKKGEEYGEKMGERMSLELQLRELLSDKMKEAGEYDKERAEEIEKILLSEEDLMTKYESIQDILLEINKAEGLNMINRIVIANLARDIVKAKEDELELQEELTKATSEYEEKFRMIFGLSTGGGDDDDDDDDGNKKKPTTVEEYIAAHKEEFENWKKAQERNSYKVKQYLEKLGRAEAEAYIAAQKQFYLEDEENVDDEAEYLSEKFKESIDGQLIYLKAMLEAGEISRAEYRDRELELEQQKNDQLLQMGIDLENRKKQLVQRGIDTVYSILNSASQARYNKDMANLNQRRDAEIKSLQEQYDNELITKEQFEKRKEKLDKKLAKEELKIRQSQAKQEKALAALQVGTTTAQSILKIAAQAAVLKSNPVTFAFGVAALKQIPLVLATAGMQMTAIAAQPIPQAYKGKYDVIGRDDGRKYRADYMHSPSTGLLDSPTILAGEKPEIIIDPVTTRNLQMNFPEVIQAIQMARPQYARGRYPAMEKETIKETSFSDPVLLAMIQENTAAINELREYGVPAYLVADGDYLEKHNEVKKKYSDMKSDVDMN